MKILKYCILGFVVTTVFFLKCRQPYNPPIPKSNLGYLVVDGIIINGPDSTVINLSRTQNLTDSAFVNNPETGAFVTVVGQNSEIYPLTERSPGTYMTSGLNLNLNETYKLKIITTNGKEYLSDSVPVKQTPPIDSVFWQQDTSGVNIYLTTHDPSNNTRYYRWNYTETWQYNTYEQSSFDWVNNQIVIRDSSTQIYNCWGSDNSSSILIGSSAKLSQDVINQNPITTVPSGSEKISYEYSILVNQYAITSDEFNYLQTTKSYTEQLGGLFDPQPSQIVGNIHCVTTPSEPVLGFINASSVSSARIFVFYRNLPLPWVYVPYYLTDSCYNFLTVPDSLNSFLPPTGQRYYVLIGQTTTGNKYILTTSFCADCRLHGGTSIKPPFWQ